MITLHTVSDVVALLKTKTARDDGVEAEVFYRNGMASIEAVAAALRYLGYEVEVFDRGGLRLKLLAVPAVGTRRRKRDQTTLFDMPAASKSRGAYDEE